MTEWNWDEPYEGFVAIPIKAWTPQENPEHVEEEVHTIWVHQDEYGFAISLVRPTDDTPWYTVDFESVYPALAASIESQHSRRLNLLKKRLANGQHKKEE